MRLLTAGSSVRVRQGEPDGRAATNGGGQPFSNTLWAFSSVGQSGRLITGWSGVRVPEGPPRQTKRAPFRFRRAAKTSYLLVPSSSFDQNPLRWAFDRETGNAQRLREDRYAPKSLITEHTKQAMTHAARADREDCFAAGKAKNRRHTLCISRF